MEDEIKFFRRNDSRSANIPLVVSENGFVLRKASDASDFHVVKAAEAKRRIITGPMDGDYNLLEAPYRFAETGDASLDFVGDSIDPRALYQPSQPPTLRPQTVQPPAFVCSTSRPPGAYVLPHHAPSNAFAGPSNSQNAVAGPSNPLSSAFHGHPPTTTMESAQWNGCYNPPPSTVEGYLQQPGHYFIQPSDPAYERRLQWAKDHR
jgi:hypothetical protein